MRLLKSFDSLLFNIIGYIYLTVVGLFCIIPFMLIISGSLTSESMIIRDGYSIIPTQVSFTAYEFLFKASREFLNAYAITISITLLGTGAGIFFTSMTAYVLYRKDFKYRNVFAFFIYFTTLFNGGLVPWYIINVNYFGLKNNYLALIVIPLLNVFYILVMKNYLKCVPDAIIESAKIDGAGDFMLFLKLILPLSKPGLATIGLFIALGYWNDWYIAMLYIEKDYLYPLQYYLYRTLHKIEAYNSLAKTTGIPIPDMPKESFKLAMTVVVIGPIVFLYPFVQKYFVSGITIGAVKG